MKKNVILGILFIFLVQFVSAEITLSEPDAVYNLADRLYVSADGLVGTESGNLNIDLVCGNSTTNLVKISGRAFSPEEPQLYSIPYKILDPVDLEISNISSVLGSCQILASLGTDASSTDIFEITDEVFVSASLNKSSYDPGEEIILNVLAVKANGENLNGFLDASNASSFSKAVVDGSVSESFFMPENSEAGTYYLALSAYDVDNSGILNKGESFISFEINTIPNAIILSLSDELVFPGGNFTFGTEILDQSGKKMDGAVSVKIISPLDEESVFSISSGEFKSIDFIYNSTPGTWNIFSTFEDLIEKREFEMAEVQKVDLSFNNSVLFIENIGNSVYNKSLNILIGNETMNLNLTLGVGEIRKFVLNAPDGEYEVVVGDGETSINQQLLLTGKVISIDDFKNAGIVKNPIVVWIFLFVIVLSIGIVMFFKFRKTKTLKNGKGLTNKDISKVRTDFHSNKKVGFFGKKLNFLKSKFSSKVPKKFKSEASGSLNFTNKSPASQSLDSSNHHPEDKSMVDLTKNGASSAESSLVLKGNKYPSTIIAISLKNYNEITDFSKQELIKILENACGDKGLLDLRGEHIFIVFSPLMTKTYDNEVLASKAGFKILKSLQTYNKKFKDKIEFNIGVHSGDLISSKEGKKLKYTGVGNVISFSKRISDSNKNQLLVSDNIRKKMLRDLKVTKVEPIGENPIYSVSEIKNKEANEAKLKDLLKRM